MPRAICLKVDALLLHGNCNALYSQNGHHTSHGHDTSILHTQILCLCCVAGPLLDTMGARFWYGISFLAAATVAAFTALATKPWMLYVSRLPAIFELAPLCAKVLITERSSEASRARMIGYNGVALGAGFVVRPWIQRHGN